MKKETRKDPRGRKVGFYVPAERLEDLFTALRMNAQQLAGSLDVSPALIVHWKQTHNIDPRHLREMCKLLKLVKVQDGEHKTAWKRVTSYLAQFNDATGSAVPTFLAQSIIPIATGAANIADLDLSRVPDRILIEELSRRGWDASKMLLEATKTQEVRRERKKSTR